MCILLRPAALHCTKIKDTEHCPLGESCLPTETSFKAVQQAELCLVRSHLGNCLYHIPSHISIASLLITFPCIPNSTH